MRQKTLFHGGKTLWLSMLALIGLIASCADGFDSDEKFNAGVVGVEALQSPAESDVVISRVFNADGSQSVKVSWPVVYGAKNYECKAVNITDAKTVFEGNVDGVSFMFPREKDKDYEISIRPLGNKELNNGDALTATTLKHSTFVQPTLISATDGDLGTVIKKAIAEYNDAEYIFQLEAGKEYTLNTEMDFGETMVTLQGDENNRPIVNIGTDGAIRTGSTLNINYVAFDCTSQSSYGVVELTSNPDASHDPANFEGYPENAYIMPYPVIMTGCWFKNVKYCLFFTGACAWAVEDVRVIDCIVQLDNEGKFGDAAIIGTYSGTSNFRGGASWNAAIRNVTLKNSTFYNLKENSKNRVIRFMSNQLGRVFDSQTGGATVENCTFHKTFTDKEFANNTPNRAEYTITFNGNILSETYRLMKFIQGNNTKNVDPLSNTVWHSTQMSDSNTSAESCAQAEDPQFVGPIDQALDLTKPNGGVNFKATGSISSTIGDPRWK